MLLDISTSYFRKGFKAFLNSLSASSALLGSSQAELGRDEACENGGQVRLLKKNLFQEKCAQGTPKALRAAEMLNRRLFRCL